MTKESTVGVPLTVFSDDETLFRDTIAQFATANIRPLVRQMDEEAHLDADRKSVV